MFRKNMSTSFNVNSIVFMLISLWDCIIACESRRRGNLNFTCCGALRQPLYMLEKVFPGYG